MQRVLLPLLVSVMLGLAGPAAAFTVTKSTTGTSTGTSTGSSGSTTGSCVGDLTASKSSSGSTSTTSGCSTTPSGVDDDGDGMPSTWEQIFSLNKYSAADAATDLDNDFISNLVEYLRALIPIDNDTDGDGVLDGDDSDPKNASSGELSLDGQYKGSATNESISVE